MTDYYRAQPRESAVIREKGSAKDASEGDEMARLQAMLDQMPEALRLVDAAGQVVLLNAPAHALVREGDDAALGAQACADDARALAVVWDGDAAALGAQACADDAPARAAGAERHVSRLDAEAAQALTAQVAGILETSTHLDAALARVLPLLRAALGWDVILVWGADAREDGLRWLGGTADAATGAAEFLDTSRYLVLRAGLELAGQAWAARAPVWSTALEEGGARLRALAAARAGLRSGVAVPLISAGFVHGVLECFSRTARPSEPSTERMLTILALLVAAFMDCLAAHETARTSVLRLAQVTSNAPVVVYEVETSGVITMCEGQGLSALGLMPGDLVGRAIADVHGDPSEMLTAVRRALDGDTAVAPLRARDARLLMRWSPLSDAEGTIHGAIGVATVASAPHHAETLLRQSEAFFDAVTRDSRELVSVIDAHGRLLYASPSYASILGYDPESLVGRGGLSAALHPDDAPLAQQVWRTVLMQPGQRATARLRLRHGDGSWRWLQVHYANYLDTPEIGGVVCNAQDVTELAAREEWQRHSQRQAAVVEGANQGRY